MGKQILKLKRDWIGRHVRLLVDLKNNAGEVFHAGLEMVVEDNYGGLRLRYPKEVNTIIDPNRHRCISRVQENKVELLKEGV